MYSVDRDERTESANLGVVNGVLVGSIGGHVFYEVLVELQPCH